MIMKMVPAGILRLTGSEVLGRAARLKDELVAALQSAFALQRHSSAQLYPCGIARKEISPVVFSSVTSIAPALELIHPVIELFLCFW